MSEWNSGERQKSKQHQDGSIVASEVIKFESDENSSSQSSAKLVETPYRKSAMHHHHHHQHHHHHHQSNHHRSPTNNSGSAVASAGSSNNAPSTTGMQKRIVVTSSSSSSQFEVAGGGFFKQALSSLLLNTKNDVALQKWLAELQTEALSGGAERRSLPLELKNRQFVESTSSSSASTAVVAVARAATTTTTTTNSTTSSSGRPVRSSRSRHGSSSEQQQQNAAAIAEMRCRLLALVDSHLTSLLISPLKLADFRLALVDRLRSTENDSVEQFVLTMYEFFSATLFFKLLSSSAVKIEWSYRLKSYVVGFPI